MGGCIDVPEQRCLILWRFLPVWEGVSDYSSESRLFDLFPPCMGGCIVKGVFAKATFEVSSLHGRVYQENQIMTLTNVLFPPYMGGCIRISIAIQDNAYVSSLYGRVYRWLRGLFPHFVGFLPVREGVSVGSKYGCPYLTSPPCMGGCIIEE